MQAYEALLPKLEDLLYEYMQAQTQVQSSKPKLSTNRKAKGCMCPRQGLAATKSAAAMPTVDSNQRWAGRVSYLCILGCLGLHLLQGSFYIFLLCQQRHHMISVEVLVCLECCQAGLMILSLPEISNRV